MFTPLGAARLRSLFFFSHFSSLSDLVSSFSLGRHHHSPPPYFSLFSGFSPSRHSPYFSSPHVVFFFCQSHHQPLIIFFLLTAMPPRLRAAIFWFFFTRTPAALLLPDTPSSVSQLPLLSRLPMPASSPLSGYFLSLTEGVVLQDDEVRENRIGLLRCCEVSSSFSPPLSVQRKAAQAFTSQAVWWSSSQHKQGRQQAGRMGASFSPPASQATQASPITGGR